MTSDEIARQIQRLRSSDSGEARAALLADASPGDVPALIAAYDVERNAQVKAMLVEIIWQKRTPDSLDFLAQALQRPESPIWKAALDGMTAIGGSAALALLEAEKTRLYATLAADISFRVGWIDEAIDQITRDSAP